MPDILKGQRLIALFLLGNILFNYPLLSLFSHEGTMGGIPILYVYIFTAWLALIGVMAIITKR